jgi:anti-anti-sigma factor
VKERVQDARPRAAPSDASADGRLDVEVHHPGSGSGSTLVRLRGALDAETAGALDARLAQVMRRRRPEPRLLLLDLSGVTSLTARGLDALLHVEEAMADANGAVELLDPSPQIVLMLHEAAEEHSTTLTSRDSCER